jgi:hypothetical protein
VDEPGDGCRFGFWGGKGGAWAGVLVEMVERVFSCSVILGDACGGMEGKTRWRVRVRERDER